MADTGAGVDGYVYVPPAACNVTKTYSVAFYHSQLEFHISKTAQIFVSRFLMQRFA